jgi:hypothetical protein
MTDTENPRLFFPRTIEEMITAIIATDEIKRQDPEIKGGPYVSSAFILDLCRRIQALEGAAND